jgi:quercetin dioxygenase-like cupin family protein
MFNGGMTNPSFQPKPYSLAPYDGKKIHSHGTLMVIKATSEQAGGAFNLFEVTYPSGYTTSLEIHYAEDVAVYILEGALTIFWGSDKKEAVVGSFFFQPRGIPHGFRVEGDTPARILYMTFPAGIDRFVIERGQFAPNCESVTAAARHKIEILGPLPE